jgi:hypothetical protein
MSKLKRGGVIIGITVAAMTMLAAPALAAMRPSTGDASRIVINPTAAPTADPTANPTGSAEAEPADTCNAATEGAFTSAAFRIRAEPTVECYGTYIIYTLKPDAKEPTVTLTLRMTYAHCTITKITIDPKEAGTVKDNVITFTPGVNAVVVTISTTVTCGTTEHTPKPLELAIRPSGSISVGQGK